MRAFIARNLGGIDSLRLEDAAAPGAPGPGQARIAMRAASVNYRDLIVLSGAMRQVTLPDLVPCSDGSGEVVETGAGVWRVKKGDRVALTFNPDWIAGPFRATPGAPGRGGAVHGVMRDELVVDQNELVKLPDHLSFEEAATLPCAAVTAWHALCAAAPLMPGMSVLTQGAGGVAVFVLQLAKLFGARVIMTSSSAERCARLASLGADETIDYKAEPRWSEKVRELTGGAGVDLAIDIGGAATFDQTLASTARGGRVAIVGLLTGRPTASADAFTASVDITPVRVGSRLDFETMNRAIAFHRLRPVIDSVFPFEKLPEALTRLKSGAQFGKIVMSFR